MPMNPLLSRSHRNIVPALLVTTLALTGIGMVYAEVSDPAAPARISTVYTGDVINGKKVVTSLDTNDLEAGKKHLLYFRGVQMSTGQYWYRGQGSQARQAHYADQRCAR
jgi:uncharacterized protein